MSRIYGTPAPVTEIGVSQCQVVLRETEYIVTTYLEEGMKLSSGHTGLWINRASTTRQRCLAEMPNPAGSMGPQKTPKVEMAEQDLQIASIAALHPLHQGSVAKFKT